MPIIVALEGCPIVPLRADQDHAANHLNNTNSTVVNTILEAFDDWSVSQIARANADLWCLRMAIAEVSEILTANL